MDVLTYSALNDAVILVDNVQPASEITLLAEWKAFKPGHVVYVGVYQPFKTKDPFNIHCEIPADAKNLPIALSNAQWHTFQYREILQKYPLPEYRSQKLQFDDGDEVPGGLWDVEEVRYHRDADGAHGYVGTAYNQQDRSISFPVMKSIYAGGALDGLLEREYWTLRLPDRGYTAAQLSSNSALFKSRAWYYRGMRVSSVFGSFGSAMTFPEDNRDNGQVFISDEMAEDPEIVPLDEYLFVRQEDSLANYFMSSSWRKHGEAIEKLLIERKENLARKEAVIEASLAAKRAGMEKEMGINALRANAANDQQALDDFEQKRRMAWLHYWLRGSQTDDQRISPDRSVEIVKKRALLFPVRNKHFEGWVRDNAPQALEVKINVELLTRLVEAGLTVPADYMVDSEKDVPEMRPARLWL